MEILGLIPARGGSKSIPQKNIALVAGRPLLAYTCEAALGSQLLTHVLLSTDDADIAAVGRACGVEVPFLRPADLARDETPILPVIEHALEWLASTGWHPDIVCLLQPTSPLRQARHIDEALTILQESTADSVVSVVEVPHQFNPVSVMKIAEDGYLQPFLPGEVILRRQDKPRVCARNGPAILAVRTSVLLAQHTLFGNRCLPYFMAAEASLDIDSQYDLTLADLLLRCRMTG